MYAIGIDIGGMSIKFGLVDEQGVIVERSVVKTAKTFDEAIEDIVVKIKELLNKRSLQVSDIKGVGFGCPGAVNGITGVIEYLPNLGWEKEPIAEKLRKFFDTEIKISNDANVAALAEVVYGSAKDYSDAIMFTLGTGVGGGIVIGRKLYEGYMSRGAELGHATLVLGGESCTCGRAGCIECYTSATALIKQTKQKMQECKSSIMWNYVDNNIDNVNGKTAFECSKKGDKAATEVVDTYIMYLGESILNMLNIFRPEVFIIGGGVSAQGEYLINKLTEYCEKFDYGYKSAPRTKIITASLGNDAGIIGAAALLQ